MSIHRHLWLIATAIIAILCSSFPASGAPGDVVFGVGDGNANGTGGNSMLYQITGYSTTPKIVNIGNTGVLLMDLAIKPVTRVFYGLTNSTLYTLNSSTGASTAVGNFDATASAAGLNSLEFDPSGSKLYAWGTTDNYLYTINPTTAVATRVGNTGYSSGGDLAWDASSGMLFGTTASNQLVKINPTTAATTLIGTLSITGSAFGLIEDGSGNLVVGSELTSHGVTLYSVNKTTAAVTLIGSPSTTVGVYGMAVVPEPGSAALILSTLVFWLRLRRNRR